MHGLSAYVAIGKPVRPSFAFVPNSHIRIAIGPIAVLLAVYDIDLLFWSMAKKDKEARDE